MASKNSTKGQIKDFYSEDWSGHTHYEVEAAIKEKLQVIEGNTSKTSLLVSIVGGSSKSYLTGATEATFYYKISYTKGTEEENSCRARIAVRYGTTSRTIFEATVAAGVEINTGVENIAQYLVSDEVRFVVTAFDIDENNEEVYPNTTTATFTRQTAQITSLVDFATVKAVGETLRHNFSYSTNSATVYWRISTINNGTLEYFSFGGQNYSSIAIANQGYANDPITVPAGLTKGSHTLEVWMVLNDAVQTESNHVYSTFVTTNGATEGDQFVTVGEIENATINDYVEIQYSAFRYTSQSGIIELPVVLMANNEVLAVRNCQNGEPYTWKYLIKNASTPIVIAIPEIDNEGNIRYDYNDNIILSDAAVYKTINAAPSAINWAQETTGLIAYFSAYNKSNSNYERDVWKSGEYSIEFDDVQFDDNGSGWKEMPLNDEGKYDISSTKKTTSLHLIGTSKAITKNLFPLYSTTTAVSSSRGGGILDTGRTIKLSFMVSNVSNPSTKIIDCYDGANNVGFYVTGDAIYVNIGKELVSIPTESQEKAGAGTGHNDRHFSADRRIDLTITIQPYYSNGVPTKHEVRYYVNGEVAGFNVISVNSLSQNNPIPITFGGTGATLDLFDLRVYNTVLSAFNVLQTRTMDIDNSVEAQAVYVKNTGPDANNRFYEIEEGNPKLTLAAAINYGKWLASQGKTNFAVWGTTNLCNSAPYINNTKTHSTKPEAFWLFRFKNDEGIGVIDENLSFYIEATGIKLEDQESFLRLRRQGTSTAKEAFGNIRVDVRGTCIVHKLIPGTSQFYPDTDDNRAAGYIQEVGKKAKIWRIPDENAIPCYLLTCKKNPNESTQARNLPTAKWYEDCCRYLAKQGSEGNYPYEDCLTMPQRRELQSILEHTDMTHSEAIDAIKTRQCVDGIPSLGFEIEYDSPNALNPTNASHSFGGQFDMITDKTNMDVFGFGGYNEWQDDEGNIKFVSWGKNGNPDDEDFSIEWRRNDSPICNFHTADLSGLDANDSTSGSEDNTVQNNPLAKDLDYRYPEWSKDSEDSSLVVSWSSLSSEGGTQSKYSATRGMEKSGPMQKLFDFVKTCSLGATKTSGKVYINGKEQDAYTYYADMGITGGYAGQLPIFYDNGTITWRTDNDNTRKEKFKTELHHYVVQNQILFNALAIDVALMSDQDTKNQFFTYFTGELDDSELEVFEGNKLLRLLGYDFDSSWRMDNDNNLRFKYTVKYLDGLYDGGATYTYSNGNQEVVGPMLWKLVFECFQSELSTLKSLLYSGFLNKNSVLSYMHDNQVDIYNAIQYNANSEYSYTSQPNDYQKSHGSAREDTEWFIDGRMYFISGQNFNATRDTSADFFQGDAYFNLTTFNDAFKEEYPNNAANRGGELKNWELAVTGYERTNVALMYGSSNAFPAVEVNVTQEYDSNYKPIGNPVRPVAYVKTNDGFNADSPVDNRFQLFGGRYIKTISGLSKWYIASITRWGDLINVEELEIGSTESWANNGKIEYYRNPNLQNLGILDSDRPFGSCKKLNLAGCIAIGSDSGGELSLLKFPILEEFEGIRMDSVRSITLPVGNSMKTIHYPAYLHSVTINNKPNLSEVSFEGTENITEITITDSSNYIAQLAITKFL